MVINERVDLGAHYDRRRFDEAGLACDLFVSRTGAEPVVLLHELPAITPQVAQLGGVLRAAGFRVYMPSLLGRPGEVPNTGDQIKSMWQACVRQTLLGRQKGDVTRGAVAGLRRLSQLASAEAGGGRVGVIGLCLTGGFALATATDPAVAAAVACEPSLPLGSAADIDISPPDQATLAERVRTGDLRAMLLRFQGDTLSPCVKLRRFGAAMPEGLASRCLPDDAADKAYRSLVPHHSVLTNHLVDAPGSLTLAVRDEVVDFFKWRLRGEPAPLPSHGLPDCLTRGCVRGTPEGPRPPG